MKKKLTTVAVCVLVVCGLLLSSGALATKPSKDVNPNGFPSGKHYNLNIIAVSRNNADNGVGSSMGHTLFVKESGNTKIWMNPGSAFEVDDRWGLDGDGASFIIPYDPESPSAYDVYARALGTPVGKVRIKAYYNKTSDETIYHLGTVNLTRKHGQPKAENINKLFYVGHTWIFDEEFFEEYWWMYNNSVDGEDPVKLLQVRFYENTTYTLPT